MLPRLLEIVRCPFCGGRLSIEAGAAFLEEELTNGVLTCRCCAYPVVAGIPVVRTGSEASDALRAIETGDHHAALLGLLQLSGERREQFERLQRSASDLTFRSALAVLSPHAEGEYFLYRFSDPTFLVSNAVIEALAQDERCTSRFVLDLCGGTGHLTRSLTRVAQPGRVVLADLAFWELWLAKQFVAPDCLPVCCNANEALPFARDVFSLVLCSGAFEYVWSRRMLADEMARLVGSRGVVALTHVHNALCENPSTGMPLDPAGYRGLFDSVPVRLFRESAVLDSVLTRTGVNLSMDLSDEDLAAEPALDVVATELEGIFRQYAPPAARIIARPALNPLYAADPADPVRATLRFPSEFYEAEFQELRRYLPEALTLPGPLRANRSVEAPDEALRRLAEQHIMLDLPDRYL